MSIKKVFNELNTLLAANQDKLVSELMPQLIELMSSKNASGSNGPTSYKDENGKVIAVFCYYHKKWELVADHEYGAKAGTTTGLNSMCKLGVNQWTKQQREFKKAQSALLTRLASGELEVSQLSEAQAELNVAKDSIVFAESYPTAFDSLDDLLDSLELQEVKPTAKVPKAKVPKAKVAKAKVAKVVAVQEDDWNVPS